jgi:hypothetical protein
MLAKNIIIAFALAAVGMGNPVEQRSGGQDCSNRSDGKDKPKYCPNIGVGIIVVPVQLCSLGRLPF